MLSCERATPLAVASTTMAGGAPAPHRRVHPLLAWSVYCQGSRVHDRRVVEFAQSISTQPLIFLLFAQFSFTWLHAMQTP